MTEHCISTGTSLCQTQYATHIILSKENKDTEIVGFTYNLQIVDTIFYLKRNQNTKDRRLCIKNNASNKWHILLYENPCDNTSLATLHTLSPKQYLTLYNFKDSSINTSEFIVFLRIVENPILLEEIDKEENNRLWNYLDLLYHEKYFTDMVVRSAEPHLFACHQAILATSSPVMDDTLSSFDIGGMRSPDDIHLILNAIDNYVSFKALMRYLYTGMTDIDKHVDPHNAYGELYITNHERLMYDACTYNFKYFHRIYEMELIIAAWKHVNLRPCLNQIAHESAYSGLKRFLSTFRLSPKYQYDFTVKVSKNLRCKGMSALGNNYRNSVTLPLVIQNISEFTGTRVSEEVIISGIPVKFQLNKSVDGFLSVYVIFGRKGCPKIHYVNTITVVMVPSIYEGRAYVKGGNKYCICADGEATLEYFLSWENLTNTNYGYIQNDSVTVQIFIHVDDKWVGNFLEESAGFHQS